MNTQILNPEAHKKALNAVWMAQHHIRESKRMRNADGYTPQHVAKELQNVSFYRNQAIAYFIWSHRPPLENFCGGCGEKLPKGQNVCSWVCARDFYN